MTTEKRWNLLDNAVDHEVVGGELRTMPPLGPRHAMLSQPQPSPFGSREALRARQAEWDRFHEWERRHPRRFPDLNTAWRWYQEVYELARKTGAIPAVRVLDMRKVRRVQDVQARLSLLRWPI